MDFNNTMYILMHYINAQKLYTLKALYIERQGRGHYKLMLASRELSWLLIPRTLWNQCKRSLYAISFPVAMYIYCIVCIEAWPTMMRAPNMQKR